MRLTAHQKKTLKKLLNQACKLRDGEECIKCGKTTTLCASHIYPKGRERKMEWELDNVKTLCYACHIHWWHKHPMEAKDWIETVLSPERLNRLKLMSQSTEKIPVDYNLIKLDLENQIKKYGGTKT